MNFIRVASSWVHAYYYDQGDLYVTYHDKRGRVTVTCHYANVPIEMWTDFLEAPSKGSYVHYSGLYRWPYSLI